MQRTEKLQVVACDENYWIFQNMENQNFQI